MCNTLCSKGSLRMRLAFLGLVDTQYQKEKEKNKYNSFIQSSYDVLYKKQLPIDYECIHLRLKMKENCFL